MPRLCSGEEAAAGPGLCLDLSQAPLLVLEVSLCCVVDKGDFYCHIQPRPFFKHILSFLNLWKHCLSASQLCFHTMWPCPFCVSEWKPGPRPRTSLRATAGAPRLCTLLHRATRVLSCSQTEGRAPAGSRTTTRFAAVGGGRAPKPQGL